MRKLSSLFILLLFCSACGNRIEAGDSLKKQDFDRLYSLNLLDTNERIYKFYSEFKNSVAGNFYSDKRLATYWLDERDNFKNKVEYAFYKDIAKIDTVYYAGATYCPYMRITRTDNSSFKVCVDGNRQQIADFFNEAIRSYEILQGNSGALYGTPGNKTAVSGTKT